MPDPTPNVVKPNSTLAAGATMPVGWSRATDTPCDLKAYKRRAVYSGVKTSVDAAYGNIKTFYGDNALSIHISSSGGSGVSEISVEYSSHIGTAGGGGSYPDDNEPVSPDTYQLQSITVPTALSSHPAFAAIPAIVEAIDDAFAHDDRDYAVFAAGSDTAAQKYLALKYAGVTQWEATGFVWRVTRHYSTLADVTAIQTAAAAAIATGTVYTWANVEGHGEISEPKYVYQTAAGTTSAAQSFEWRLAGVSVTRTDTNLDLTYEYQGAWKWAAALYPGGTWSPTVPQ